MSNLTTVNNGMSNEEFKNFCINYQNQKSKKEIDFLDFTCFILDTGIHNDEDMGFLMEGDYHDGNFDNCKYERGENVWKVLEELIGRDFEQMEEDFEYCSWEDNNNTCIAKFKNDNKKYAVLRM